MSTTWFGKRAWRTDRGRAAAKGLFPAAMPNPRATAGRSPVGSDEFKVAELPPPRTPPSPSTACRVIADVSPLDVDGQADIMAPQGEGSGSWRPAPTWVAFKIMLGNPVGGLKPAFDSLGGLRAKAVGIVFGVVFDFCILIGVRLLANSFGSLSLQVAGDTSGQVHMSFPLTAYIKLYRSRDPRDCRRFQPHCGGSFRQKAIWIATFSRRRRCYPSTSAKAPSMAGILGVLNFEVSMVIIVFAVTTTVLMLNGCTMPRTPRDGGDCRGTADLYSICTSGKLSWRFERRTVPAACSSRHDQITLVRIPLSEGLIMNRMRCR